MSVVVVLAGCDAVQGLVANGDQAPANADAAAEKPAKGEKKQKKKKNTKLRSGEANAEKKSAARAPEKPAVVAAAVADTPPGPEAAEPEAAEPEAAEPEAAEPGAAEPESGDAALASAQPPCVIGKWEALDYRAVIERAIRKDPELRKFHYASGGGTLGYEVEAPTEGRAGTVKQIAENVTYKFAGTIQGFKVGLTVKLNGENVAAYELKEPNRITIKPPTEKNLKVRAHVAVKGLGKATRSKKVDLDFDGEFIYVCEGDGMKVLNAVNEKERPLTFKRVTEG